MIIHQGYYFYRKKWRFYQYQDNGEMFPTSLHNEIINEPEILELQTEFVSMICDED
ncbi:hypothetical protein HanRHA438_Chr05g0202621 [Helianthus annuus]|nr:hypothetical protein HanRHA438_Chr05g0202621 [Helianthus annuus]